MDVFVFYLHFFRVSILGEETASAAAEDAVQSYRDKVQWRLSTDLTKSSAVSKAHVKSPL